MKLRLKCTHYIVLVVAISLCLAFVRTISPLVFYADGPNQSLLEKGQLVWVLSPDGHRVHASYQGESVEVSEMTVCHVILDFAGDRDDAIDTERDVIVRVANGPDTGKKLKLPRNRLTTGL